jgi:hypothetical protein
MIQVSEFTAAPWPADRLSEARAILADIAHHPETRLVLAARVIVRHSRDEAECREACALRRLFDTKPRSGTPATACRQGGAA